MKLDEYRGLLADMQNPDKQGEALIKIIDGLESDLSQRDTLVSECENLNATINTLRDTNAKLVLRVTEPVQPQQDPEPEKTPDEELGALIELINKED